MEPDARPAGEIGLDIPLGVLDEAACHRRRRLFEHQIAQRIADRFAVIVHHIDIHSQTRSAERAWLDVYDRRTGKEATHELRASGDIDDRAASPSNLVKEPEVGFTIPGL